MENELLELVLTSMGMSWVVTGIVNKIKEHVVMEGLQVIAVAIFTGTVLLGSFAIVFGHPIAESLLLGVITGFASIGSFEGLDKGKEFIKDK